MQPYHTHTYLFHLFSVHELALRISLLTRPLQDIFIIATSSCARFMPSRRGYSALSVSANGSSNSRGRNNRAEDENRLIDQLDEEWDD